MMDWNGLAIVLLFYAACLAGVGLFAGWLIWG